MTKYRSIKVTEQCYKAVKKAAYHSGRTMLQVVWEKFKKGLKTGGKK